MKHHVAKMAAICHYHLRHLRQIRRRVGQEVTTRLVLAMVISRLDYCNAALAGLPQATIAPQQRVQNSAARLIFKPSSREHVNPYLLQLHWLPMWWCIQFKLCCIMHSVSYDTSPAYLTNIVDPLVPAIHALVYVQHRRLTTRCSGCALSSRNKRSRTQDRPHGTDCPKICTPWQTQLSFENSWKLTYVYWHLLLWTLSFHVFRTVVMHLCACL